MYKKTLRNRIVWVIAILLIITFAVFSGMIIFQYAEATMLCRQIQNMESINTTFSNGSTAPLFFDKLTQFFQVSGPKIPLIEACYYRNIQAVEVLLSNGADPNLFLPGRMSALEAALRNGPAGPMDEKSLQIAEMLVASGCDVNLHASDEDIITELASSMVLDYDNSIKEEMLIFLLDHGASREHDGYELVFHNMIRRGDVAFVRQLIDTYHFDVNGVGHNGQTPLILAITYSTRSATTDMITLLLAEGADVAARDDHGKTALDYARETGNTKIASLLESFG